MKTNSNNLLPAWRPSQVISATLFVVMVAAAFWLLVMFRSVIFILFIAIVISTAITPAVEWLARRGLSRAVGVILIYCLLLALLVGPVVAFAPLALNQVSNIGNTLPEYYREFQDWILASPSLLIRRLALELPDDLSEAPVDLLGEQDPSAPPAGEISEGSGEERVGGAETGNPLIIEPDEALQRVDNVLNVTNLILKGIFITVAVFLVAFYWTLEGQRSIRNLLLYVPSERREDVREIMTQIQDRVGGYIRGVTTLCLIVGGLALVAYVLIDLPNALVLAIVAGIMEAVPVIGPGLGAVPAILVALSAEMDAKILWILVATGIIQFIENTFLVPRVMGRSAGVNPIVALLALVTFSSLLGFAGALLAIPIAAIIQLLIDRFVLRQDADGQLEPDGRDAYSMLRVEVNELALDVRKLIREKAGENPVEEDRLEDAIEEIANELDLVLNQASQEGAAQ